jgi:hypothetical protein
MRLLLALSELSPTPQDLKDTQNRLASGEN